LVEREARLWDRNGIKPFKLPSNRKKEPAKGGRGKKRQYLDHKKSVEGGGEKEMGGKKPGN